MQSTRVYFWKWACTVATRMQARLQRLLQGPQLRPLQVTRQCVLAQVQAPNSVLVPARVFFLGGEATSTASGGWRRASGGSASWTAGESLGVAENPGKHQADPVSLIAADTH